jgi:hypothetical protein
MSFAAVSLLRGMKEAHPVGLRKWPVLSAASRAEPLEHAKLCDTPVCALDLYRMGFGKPTKARPRPRPPGCVIPRHRHSKALRGRKEVSDRGTLRASRQVSLGLKTHASKRAVAERCELFSRDGPGLVLPDFGAGRLLANDPGVELKRDMTSALISELGEQAVRTFMNSATTLFTSSMFSNSLTQPSRAAPPSPRRSTAPSSPMISTGIFRTSWPYLSSC